MKKYRISIICIMLICLITTCVSFLFLNDVIPTHFGIDGKPDQFGSKYFILIFPLVSILIGSSMLLVNKYGKVSDNYRKYMLLTGCILEAIFLLLNIVFIIVAITYVEDMPAFDFSKVMMIIMGLMFIIMSNYMPKIEKNRTLGIKTKWSMYNEVTWQKTHRLAGFVGIIMGILILISGIFFKETVNFIILMSLIIIFMISLTIASYLYYKEEKNKEHLNVE